MIIRFSRTGRSLRQLLVVIPLALLVPVSTYAGNGSFSSATGEHNFCVSVQFNATPAEIQEIQDAFEKASQIVADATDDQHRFGTVTIVNNSGAPQSSEYQIHKDGAPPAGPDASEGLYGVRGAHVNLFHPSNFSSTEPDPYNNPDAYTIAHEHAHQSYGVLDEYSGPHPTIANQSVDAACAPTVPGDPTDYSLDSPLLNYSLMDRFADRGGRQQLGGSYTLNEFCVSSNHDLDGDTYQSDQHGGLSVWEVIASHPTRSATIPTGEPVDAAPPAHTVTFREGFGGLRVMLLLDRSGSMTAAMGEPGKTRIDYAKEGAQQFTELLPVGDVLGVASFSSTESLDFPLTEISDVATRNAADAAIDSLVAGGSTNIGGGLILSRNQITGQSQRSCNEIIVVLSDGDHNTGTPPAAVISSLQAENITVFSVGVAGTLSVQGEQDLIDLAEQTGGFFHPADGPLAINELWTRISNEINQANGLMTRAPGSIVTGETFEADVQLETGATGATFVLNYVDSRDEINFTLRTPSGDIITKETANDPNAGVEFIQTTYSQVFRIENPEAGTWTMLANGVSIENGSLITLAYAEHVGAQLVVALDNSTPEFPEPVTLHATPTYEGRNVVGATVTGVVTRPDGSQTPITLYDDGLSEHGDATPNNGVYSARFNNYNDDGSYIFELTMKNETGKTYAGEQLFDFIPSGQPVPPFTRSAIATAAVSGVPDFLVATVEYGPETINLKSNGNYVTAYIELPEGYSPYDIDLNTLSLAGVDDRLVVPFIEAEAKFVSTPKVGDFDSDGREDLMVKFSRCALQQVLTPGVREIYLQGTLANGGLLFIGKRSVLVKAPGNTDKPKKKECGTTHVLSDDPYVPGSNLSFSTASATSSDGSSAGAGCSFGRNTRVDPVLPLLLALSAAYLLRRRRHANR